MEEVREATTSRALALYDGMPGYRDGNMNRFVERVVPIVQAGQIRTAQLTAAYYGTPMLGEIALTGTRGVQPFEVYWRAATTIYFALSRGVEVYDAITQGRNRALDLASTDLQLAKTAQIRGSMQRLGFKHYRRVLTGNENCALCVIASTQTYPSGNLMPIHPGCDCHAEGVRSLRRNQFVIDQDLLDMTHDAVAAKLGRSEFSARDLGLDKRTARTTKRAPEGLQLSDYTELIITREHGEMGPLLTWRDDNFTGPTRFAS